MLELNDNKIERRSTEDGCRRPSRPQAALVVLFSALVAGCPSSDRSGETTDPIVNPSRSAPMDAAVSAVDVATKTSPSIALPPPDREKVSKAERDLQYYLTDLALENAEGTRAKVGRRAGALLARFERGRLPDVYVDALERWDDMAGHQLIILAGYSLWNESEREPAAQQKLRFDNLDATCPAARDEGDDGLPYRIYQSAPEKRNKVAYDVCKLERFGWVPYDKVSPHIGYSEIVFAFSVLNYLKSRGALDDGERRLLEAMITGEPAAPPAREQGPDR